MIVSADRIYLILGNACNMNCRYCLQHSLVERSDKIKYDPILVDWLKRMAEAADNQLNIMFWGGEPLVYFDTIKDVVGKLEGSDIKYSVVTNGKALTDDMVEYLNGHGFEVAISWDGRNTKETRRFDVFADEKLKQRIFSLNNLCITGVVSSMAYPLELLDDMDVLLNEYEAIRGESPNINLDFIFDTGIPDESLLQVDLQKMDEQARRIVRSIKECYVDGEDESSRALMIFALQTIQKAHIYYMAPDASGFGCGNGYRVINVDMDGTLYTCHNARDMVGHITMPFGKYIRRIIDRDPTIERLKGMCVGCPALPICRGGCKIIKDTGHYCQLRKAFYGAFFSELMLNGDDFMKGGNADEKKQ